MKKAIGLFLSAVIFAQALMCLTSCGADKSAAPIKIKALIVPKFEIGEMSGDDIGEAQLFYEEYCGGAKETAVPNMPGTARFFVNGNSGAAVLVSGMGKNACALALTAVLSDKNYDFSGAYIVSVGCAGGSAGLTTLGDIVLVTGACDNELGHTADIREFEDANSQTTWFADSSYDVTAGKLLSSALADKVYGIIKDFKPYTTDASKRVMAANFGDEEWAVREPAIIKGTALSGDSYWKGEIGHNNALKIVGSRNMPDPYAVTEMEELTVANTAECYGMLNRIISLRVVVDLDVFLGNDSPESIWSGDGGNDASGDNSASIDIFESAMRSLFDASKTVIDAVLNGEFEANR